MPMVGLPFAPAVQHNHNMLDTMPLAFQACKGQPGGRRRSGRAAQVGADCT